MSEAKLESLGDGRFRIIGAMTFETVVTLLRQSERSFDGLPRIEIDLQQVSESDSAGLALVIEWLRLARLNRRELLLINVPQQLTALARISEVSELLGDQAA